MCLVLFALLFVLCLVGCARFVAGSFPLRLLVPFFVFPVSWLRAFGSLFFIVRGGFVNFQVSELFDF